MAKPEQVEVNAQTRSVPYTGGMVTFFREWREWKQEEKRSRRYVDAIFDCYINGVITGSQLKAKLPPSLEEETYTKLGINRREVFNWATHRYIAMCLDYGLTSDAALTNPTNSG